MECQIYVESLTALMDGELTNREEQAIRTHLSGCPTCNAEYKSLRYSHELVSGVQELEFRPSSWQQIQSRIAEPPRTGLVSRVKFPRVWIPIGAFATLLLFAASLMIYSPDDGSVRTRQAFQNYMQERQQDMIRRGLVHPSSGGDAVFVHYNPFAEPTARPKGNPFRSER